MRNWRFSVKFGEKILKSIMKEQKNTLLVVVSNATPFAHCSMVEIDRSKKLIINRNARKCRRRSHSHNVIFALMASAALESDHQNRTWFYQSLHWLTFLLCGFHSKQRVYEFFSGAAVMKFDPTLATSLYTTANIWGVIWLVGISSTWVNLTQLLTDAIAISYYIVLVESSLTVDTYNNHSFVDKFPFWTSRIESCCPFKDSSPSWILCYCYWSWGFCWNYTELYRIGSKDRWKITDNLCH